jgi:branched-subunit amino acid aminotransferase/4-amino-4-deoxychorismate lyase
VDAVTAFPRIEVNGHAPAVADLSPLALVNYGHFTAMQVRGGRTRGLDLHLARLDAANRELFGAGLPGDLVRDRVRHALADVDDASVRVVVIWPESDDEPSVMVIIRPPAAPPRAPQSLRTAPYQRPVAHVKHLGGFGQTYFGRRARRDGFDDALLVDDGGVISEGAITNLGCYDGTSVVWPDAPALDGITMLLLERVLPAQGVPTRRAPVHVADLGSYASVFVTNTHGIAPVERVDDLWLPVDQAFMKTVTQAYEAVPWDPI